MYGPSSTVACALWLTCVALLLTAEAAAPGARRHDRRVRPGSAVAADRSAADQAAGAGMDADDYDRDNYDEDYEDSGDSQKRPPPPPPPPPPKTSATLTPDHRTMLLSYYNNIFISYGTTKNVTGVSLKGTKPQHLPFYIVLILPTL